MGTDARRVAYRVGIVFVCGSIVGSLAPESGNFAAYLFGFPEKFAHIFNIVFAALGIAGLALALRIGRSAHR